MHKKLVLKIAKCRVQTECVYMELFLMPWIVIQINVKPINVRHRLWAGVQWDGQPLNEYVTCSFPALPLPLIFVTSVPEPSHDSRLPERKRKRLLRRLSVSITESYTVTTTWLQLESYWGYWLIFRLTQAIFSLTGTLTGMQTFISIKPAIRNLHWPFLSLPKKTLKLTQPPDPLLVGFLNVCYFHHRKLSGVQTALSSHSRSPVLSCCYFVLLVSICSRPPRLPLANIETAVSLYWRSLAQFAVLVMLWIFRLTVVHWLSL